MQILPGSLSFACVMAVSCLTGAALQPEEVTLVWDPSTSTEVSGYRLHVGGFSGIYTNVLDLRTETIATLGGLHQGGTYYIAVTSYAADGLESALSNELSYAVPLRTRAQLAIGFGPNSKSTLTCVGPPNYTFELISSTDLLVWRTVRSITLDLDGFFEDVEPLDPSSSACFYALRQTSPSPAPLPAPFPSSAMP